MSSVPANRVPIGTTSGTTWAKVVRPGCDRGRMAADQHADELPFRAPPHPPELTAGAARVLLRIIRKDYEKMLAAQNGPRTDEVQDVA